MIITVREYPKDLEESPSHGLPPSPSEMATTPPLGFSQELIVETTSVNSKKPIIFKATTSKGTKDNSTLDGFTSIWNRVTTVFVDLFLPLGYPQSVHESYLPYQLYDGLQGLCSYWRGVVATRAVLEAAGVGDAQATAASAALQWALRDGTGMLAGLVFSYVASRYFDTHVKEYRLFADVINDVALTMDMLAPYFSGDWTLYILSLSTICKTMCGMSAGATKGRITQHFARHGNMADLSAKESTQETLVSLLGMIGGVWVAKMLQHMPYSITWILFGFLTLVHVWANYKAVKLLRLETLNPQRTRDIFQRLLDIWENKGTDKEVSDAVHNIPAPEHVDESLALSTSSLLFPWIHLDGPLDTRCLEHASTFMNEKYLIGVRKGHLHIYLKVGSSMETELQAFVHALLLEHILAKKMLTGVIMKETLTQVKKIFPSEKGESLVWQLLREKGWDVESRLYLGFGDKRYHWSLLKED
eukprot:Nitzschia sp. Nitz4//scaffold350_size17454//556//2049//NITZ4_008815-RA/size17454-augustus-gene-0.22-mRNA-1//1//CDS//3329548859//2773//frame0